MRALTVAVDPTAVATSRSRLGLVDRKQTRKSRCISMHADNARKECVLPASIDYFSLANVLPTSCMHDTLLHPLRASQLITKNRQNKPFISKCRRSRFRHGFCTPFWLSRSQLKYNARLHLHHHNYNHKVRPTWIYAAHGCRRRRTWELPLSSRAQKHSLLGRRCLAAFALSRRR
jgi:hypothetical protein